MMDDIRAKSATESPYPNNPPLDMLGRKRKDYVPPTPQENQDLKLWQHEMGLLSPYEESKMAAQLGETQQDNKILVFRDHLLEFPELYLTVAVLGPPEDTRGFPALFARSYCEGTDHIQEADLVVFTGGPDVDPAYYGEKPIPTFYGDEERDYADLAAFMECVEHGIPMLGICRGAQFLAAMQGYKLVQDIDCHQSDHSMWDKKNNIIVEKVSSRHHQAVIPGYGMETLGVSYTSTEKWLNSKSRLTKKELGVAKYPPDLEAYFIRETCSIGIQGHPEYKNYNAFAKWTLDTINNFIVLNEDITWVDNCRRIRPELRQESRLRAGVRPAEERPTLTVPSTSKEK